MKNFGPIIVIEDDLDDQELLQAAFRALEYPYQIIFFSDGYKALAYIENNTAPFLILSDVNMPLINGFELREKIQNNAEASVRSIPFLFLTTGAQNEAVKGAYARSAQGFFIKPSSTKELQGTIRKILDYWQACYSPSIIRSNQTDMPGNRNFRNSVSVV